MAFTGDYMCTSFKLDLLTGVHDFTVSTGDTIRLALYTSSATLDASTTSYGGTVGSVADTNEVSGTGYTPGGEVATVNLVSSASGTTAYLDFDNITWTTATITARGGLLFNASKSNKAIAVLDFTADKTSTAGDFTVVFPAVGTNGATAIVRIA